MKKGIFSVRKLCIMALIGAISAIVMLFEIPLWFAPPFYELDFSEIFVLIGGFALGPLAAVIIELVKIAVNTLITGTTTAFVGELANFVVGCAFVVPATVIYKYNKKRSGAILGLIMGILSFGLIGCLVNYYVMLPLYSQFMPLDEIIAMGADKNENINSLFTFVLFATLPFNLSKGVLSSIITFIIYKHVSPILHKQLDR